jgi:hypothetical protein
LNVKVALAPDVAENTARSPLRVAPTPALVVSDQAPLGVRVVELSSNRVVVGGELFDTVTVTAVEVVVFPAASRALAVRECEPLATVVVFHEVEYGEVVSSAPSAVPSRKNCTPATPTLSEAEALTVVVPETVAPEAGEVMLTVGGVVSGGGAFDTVTVTAAEVVELPAASRALAVRECEPLVAVVVFHEVENGEVVSSAPSAVPSRKNCTPATPTLSEAEALTVVVPETVAPEAGEVMLTVGGVVSGGGAFDTVTVTAAEVVELPAASRALAVRECEPLATVVVFHEVEYGEVVSSAPSAEPSTKNCTPATPTLSEAEALTVVVPETVAPEAGEVMLTVGGVVSGGGAFDTVTVTAAEVVELPAASRALAVRECEPLVAVVVFHEVEYGEVVSSAPSAVPSTKNWTPATPTLSEAEALTVVVPETVAPDDGEVMLTVGGVVSAFDTVTVTAVEVVVLPAASRALAVSE